MSDVIDRLAAPPPDPEQWAGTCTVTSAAAGTTTDGRKLIQVNWLETTVTCTYLAPYTPVVGDHVLFLKSGASFVVLGKPAT